MIFYEQNRSGFPPTAIGAYSGITSYWFFFCQGLCIGCCFHTGIADKGTLLIDGYEGQNKTAPNFTKPDWRELMEEINRQGMTPYSCRHTFLTRAIRSGMELPVLEAIVGHVDRETTKIYTHLHADDLVTAVQAMIEKPSAVRNKSVTRSEETEETIQKSS